MDLDGNIKTYGRKATKATEDKNSSNCEAVYFAESKRSLKSRLDKHKRSVASCDCDKNEITKYC